MSLVTEDGTGLANAESLVSVAEVTAYVAAFAGPLASLWTGDTAAKEARCRRATQYLVAEFGPRLKGRRKFDTQALPYPRIDVYDRDDFLVPDDSVPIQVKHACAELAIRAGDTLMADQAQQGAVKQRYVRVGPVAKSVEYSGGTELSKSYSIVEKILKPLLKGGNGIERG